MVRDTVAADLCGSADEATCRGSCVCIRAMTDYSWVRDESTFPGTLLSNGCCMTFAASLSPAEVIEWFAPTEHHRERLIDPAAVREACTEYESFAILTPPKCLVVFEPYGMWETVAEQLAVRSAQRVVCFHWNVEMDTGFSVWERGDLLLRFDAFDPDVRLGSEPDRFADDMRQAGLWSDAEESSVFDSLFALAEALTGCQIEPDFLYGDLVWGVR